VEDVHQVVELVERDAWLDLFGAAPEHVRQSLGLQSVTIAGMGLLGCRAIPITELNRAMAVGVQDVPSRDDFDAVLTWLDTHASSWALQIAPNANARGVPDYLEKASLARTGAGWAKFVRTEGVPALEPLGVEVQVETVGAAAADVFGKTVANGFGLPADCAAWFAALVDRPQWQCFLATIDGEPAAGGTMFVRDGAAWLGIEATLPAYRGRGAQRSIVARQVSAAVGMGARVQTCETAQPANRNDPGFSSYRNQERAGFTRTYTRPNFKRAE
jgi:GNAT superfamily N-acetyltransferase